jgi:hypothetical protein
LRNRRSHPTLSSASIAKALTLVMPMVEMGQGTYTALAHAAGEELEVD